MSKVMLTPLARSDLLLIWRYSKNSFGQQKAKEYYGLLIDSLKELSAFPQKGKIRNEIRPGYRSHRFKQHIIFYRFNARVIEVVRILHARMDVDRFEFVPNSSQKLA